MDEYRFLERINDLLEDLKVYKPNDRSEKDRRVAITITELEKVYNRGFSSGFYFDVPSSEEYTGVEGSKATTRKSYVGKILNYYKEIEVAHILMESGQLKTDDEILIMGETTGVLDIKLEKFSVNDKENFFHVRID